MNVFYPRKIVKNIQIYSIQIKYPQISILLRHIAQMRLEFCKPWSTSIQHKIKKKTLQFIW